MNPLHATQAFLVEPPEAADLEPPLHVTLGIEPSVGRRLRPISRLQLGCLDLLEGWNRYWHWTALAFQDLKLKYRGSMLGPFWLTLSMAIMITAMGMIYRHFFNMELSTYLPFLALGLIVWGLINTLVLEGCSIYIAVAGEISQVRMPYSMQAYRAVFRNLMVLGHNAVIVPIIFLVFRVHLHWMAVTAVLGLAVIALNGFWISLMLGMLSARFRDVPPIVASFMQVVFFMTPIFWLPSSVGKWQHTIELNPLFCWIDIVRSPLLGTPVAPLSWPIALGTTLVGCAVTFALFIRFRGRIAFWV